MMGNSRKPLVIVLLLTALVGQLFAPVVWSCPMAEENMSLKAVMVEAVMSHETHHQRLSNSVDYESSNALSCCQDISACTVAGCMGAVLLDSTLASVLSAQFSLPTSSLVESFASTPPSLIYRPPIAA